MLFALELLLVGEFFAGSQNLILRLDVRGFRSRWLCIGPGRSRWTAGKAAA